MVEYTAERSTGFLSYSELESWLHDEIGEASLSTIRRCRPPASLGNITQLPQAEANALLKRVFIENFVSERDYERQVQFLANPNPRETRLKIRSPLPSTDFGILLKPTPSVSYLQRAAALTHSAANLHLQFRQGDKSTALSRSAGRHNCSVYDNIFGVCIQPEQTSSRVCISKDSTRINVLFRGHAYSLQVLEGNDAISPAKICQGLEAIVQGGADTPGHTGLLRSVPLNCAFESAGSLNTSAIQQLTQSLFTVCLDDVGTQPSTSRNDRFTSLFSTNRHNRWYGGTQIAVGTNGDAAILFSYMCCVEGVQAVEVADELHNRSRKIPFESPSDADCPLVSRLDLGIPQSMIRDLTIASDPLFHKETSVFSVPLGMTFLKQANVSPNAAIHLLMMLAFREVGQLSYLPETSQAVVVREHLWGGVQLDWLRARPETLRTFLEAPQDTSRFRLATQQHKALTGKCKNSLTPFLFFDSQIDAKNKDLARFYLALGQEEAVGAYRHYLCPLTRDPHALDIISSSLRLREGIDLVGRPGTRSKLVGMSGSHIMFEDDETHIVFTPTKEWEGRLPDVVECLAKWMAKLTKEGNQGA